MIYDFRKRFTKTNINNFRQSCQRFSPFLSAQALPFKQKGNCGGKKIVPSFCHFFYNPRLSGLHFCFFAASHGYAAPGAKRD